MHQFLSVFPEGFHVNFESNIDVYYALVVSLPFRIRTGKILRLSPSCNIDVVFRNPIDIPNGMAVDQAIRLPSRGGDDSTMDRFNTEALILDKEPKRPAGFLSSLVKYLDRTQEVKFPELGTRFKESLKSLNESIVAYHHATDCMSGGVGTVERLSLRTFYERIRFGKPLICDAGYEFRDSEIVEMFDAQHQFMIAKDSTVYGALDDFESDRIGTIDTYLKLNNRFPFYRFVLDARSKMSEGDLISAILFAVVALENVHAIIFQRRLERQMRPSVDSDEHRYKLAEEKSSELLREVGFSKSLDLTSLLFLSCDEKLEEEEVQKCKLGISIRNEIMHSIVKRGKYRLHNRTENQIQVAYSSVLKAVEHFASIIESEEGDEPGG